MVIYKCYNDLDLNFNRSKSMQAFCVDQNVSITPPPQTPDYSHSKLQTPQITDTVWYLQKCSFTEPPGCNLALEKQTLFLAEFQIGANQCYWVGRWFALKALTHAVSKWLFWVAICSLRTVPGSFYSSSNVNLSMYWQWSTLARDLLAAFKLVAVDCNNMFKLLNIYSRYLEISAISYPILE